MGFFCGLFKIQTGITGVVCISGNEGCDNYPTWGWGSGFFAENTLSSGAAVLPFPDSFCSLLFRPQGASLYTDQLGEPPWYFTGTLFYGRTMVVLLFCYGH